MKILALDLGKFNSVLCFFDSKTRKTKFLTSTTKQEPLQQVFADCDADLVVMEACGPSGWINDLAQKHGLKTLVCSTNEEAWRWANVKRKTDRDDALKLARLAAMGELKAVHTPSPEHREFRSLVKYRKTLDNRVNKTKNTIRAWFVNHGIEIATGEKAWEPNKMIEVTKSFGGKLPMDEEALRNMPKKECRHKRKRRLAKERKAAEQATKQASDQQQAKPTANRPTKASRKVASRNTPTKTPTRRRARKPVLAD